MKKKLTHVRQQDSYDCAAACVSTILFYYGLDYNLTTVRDFINTNAYGTKASDVVSGFEKLGFSCKGFKIKKSEFVSFVKKINAPCIAYVKKEELYHYVVVYSIKKNKILISDPGESDLKYIELDTFIDSYLELILMPQPKSNGNKTFSSVRKKSYLFQLIKFFCKQHKLLVLLISVFSILLMVLSVASAFYIKILADYILPNHLDHTLFVVSTVFISIAILKSLIDYIRGFLVIRVGRSFEKLLANMYFSKLFKLPPKFYTSRQEGEMISRFNDSLTLRDVVSMLVVTVIIDFFLFILSGVFLYYQNENLFLLSLVPIGLYLTLSYLFFDRLQRQNRTVMEKHADMDSYLFQVVRNIESIKSLNKHIEINKLTNDKYEKLLGNFIKEDNTVNFSSFLKKIIQSVFGVFILWMGTKQIFLDEMSFGALLTFNALLVYFAGSAENIVNLQPVVQKGIVAAERFFEIINYPTKDSHNTKKIEDVIHEIEIKDLNFTYSGRNNILNDFNLDIKHGEFVAFVGSSGCGKSTVAKIITKLLDVSDECVYVNKIDINTIDDISLRDRIKYVSPESFFTKDSVLENINLGKEKDPSVLRKALEASCLDHVLNTLPGGLNYRLEENAKNLSLGQKQVLILARALISNPDVLILDETIGNIDVNTRNQIIENLKRLDCITIVITHNVDDLSKFDKIFEFNDGKAITKERQMA
ncbi:peptidase domain-containing ABC transporter [Metabacillus sp. SLBN-84]